MNPRKDYTHGGFFVLRAPLLSTDVLEQWAGDREHALTFLGTHLENARVREAIHVASPGLFERLPAGKDLRTVDRKVQLSAAKYLVRMSYRPTPFGLFAGVSTGVVGDRTELEVSDALTRHTRLDADVLARLYEQFERDPKLRRTSSLTTNSTLTFDGFRYRCSVPRLTPKGARQWVLLSIPDAPHTRAAIETARRATAFNTVAEAVQKAAGVDLDTARQFVDDLIEKAILCTNLRPQVTAKESAISELVQLSESTGLEEGLRSLQSVLRSMDASGVGSSTVESSKEVDDILARVETTGDQPNSHKASMQTNDRSNHVQVDMLREAPNLRLGASVTRDLLDAVRVLHLLTPTPPESELDRFRTAFLERYDQASVPILQALDEENGVPFGRAHDTTEALEGVQLRRERTRERSVVSARQRGLAEALLASARENDRCVELSLETIERWAQSEGERPPLPNAFHVTVVLSAESSEAVDRGDYELYIPAASGPSGVNPLSRFAPLSSVLADNLQKLVEAEETLTPDKRFAEILHLPESRLGNVAFRPVLRKFEIPVFDRGGGTPIALADLRLRVREGRFELLDQEGREIIPRLTSALNPDHFANQSLHRFLVALAKQGVASVVGFHWDTLGSLSHLPRVRCGRFVLSLETWNLGETHLSRIAKAPKEDRAKQLQVLRAELSLPRWVQLTEFDNTLPIDLDNPLLVDVLSEVLAQKKWATLTEVFPALDRGPVRCAGQRLTHELVVPFVRKTATPTSRPEPKTAPANIYRRLTPGSECLYLKLYCGFATANLVLRDVVAPLVRQHGGSWFFIRYGDPKLHLRVRFFGDPENLWSHLLPIVHKTTEPLVRAGVLHSVQLDTYEREIERYGGSRGVLLAEQLFHADSELVLKAAPGAFRLAFLGVHTLLEDFGLDLEGKRRQVRRMFEGRSKELGLERVADLDRNLRKRRKELESALDSREDILATLLRERSDRSRSAVEELRSLDRAGRLETPLDDYLFSLAHMHANRVFRSLQTQQEMVVFHALDALYTSRLARRS